MRILNQHLMYGSIGDAIEESHIDGHDILLGSIEKPSSLHSNAQMIPVEHRHLCVLSVQ